MAKELMSSVAVPVFFSVTVCAAEVAPKAVVGKVRLVGEKRTAGPLAVTPFSATAWGDAGALSVTETAAVLVPLPLGE